MTGAPPTMWRTTRLLAGLLARRWWNRVLALRQRKPRAIPGAPANAAAPAGRSGTARKGGFGAVGVLLLGVLMSCNGVNISARVLTTAREQIGLVYDARGRIEISDNGFWRQIQNPSRGWGVGDDKKFSQAAFVRETARYPEEQRAPSLAAMEKAYAERGGRGFAQMRNPTALLPRITAWSSPVAGPKLLHLASALLTVFSVATLCLGLGSANQDLGKVEWTFTWFFTFPAPAKNLFLAQILGHALIDPLIWIGGLPLLFTIFWSAGFGWKGLAMAAAGALYFGLILASLRIVIETLLRTTLALSRVKNLQAFFTLLGTVSLFLLVANAGASSVARSLAAYAINLPPVIAWTPFALPVWLCVSAPLPVVLGALAAVAIGVPLLATNVCAWLVRGGLITTGGVYSGHRQTPPAAAPKRPAAPRGIIGKDVRLLLRDRNFLVQTLVVPVLVIGFQLVINNGMLSAVRTNFQHASVLAFAVGSYVLIATALSVLSVEGNSLWMLFTFPRRIESILLEKTRLWSGFALVYCAVVLAVCASQNPALAFGDSVFAAVALAGVVIYAFIAAGLGVLATDPLETEVRRRVRPEMVQLYMLLAAMYAYAIYAPSAWTRLAQMILSALLAFALWQKVRDRAPFLLDPVAAPPPQISLADGLVAALAFFVLQGIFMIGALALRAPIGVALVVAFSGSGGLVVLLSIYTFWRLKMPHILRSVGLRRKEGAPAGAWVRAVLLGVVTGLAAGAFGAIYLHYVEIIPALSKLKQSAMQLPAGAEWWLIGLAVLAAPLFEEFIFRGLVFRGLRRSAPLAVAIFGSAAIFAIVHPAISVLPVFIMAVLSAWSFHRSGLLLSSIITHCVYNTAVIFATAWLAR